MDYKTKYREAQKWIESIYSELSHEQQMEAEAFFPELEESKDERIRKEIIAFIKKRDRSGCDYDYDQWIAWLEKQGDQSLANKVEPKFHEGEWITNGDYTWKIVEVKPLDYILQSQEGNIVDDTISHVDEQFHSFTIKDAKDGDVLASNRSIFIFSQEYIAGKPEAHCGIMNGLFLAKPEGCWTNEECYPATKEQRDQLEKAMADAGYTFDFEKKESKLLITNGGDFDEKNCEQKHSIDINKMIDDYANSSERGNEEFGKPVPCMIRAYRQGLNDAIGKVVRNPAWSEEDETGWTNTMIMIKEVASNHYTKDSIKLVIDWLKSLKERYTWKPSEEQISSLRDVIYNLPHQPVLFTLYNDLKKLKGE